MSSTSTPLSNFSTRSNFTSNPPILHQPMDSNDTSFCSTLSSVPIHVPELSGITANKGSLLRKRLYRCVTLLVLVSCLSLLIFISLNISGYISFSGNLEGNLKIPGVGGLNASIRTEEVLNFSSKVNTALSSKLSKMESETPSQLWDQVYMNLKPS